MEEGKKKKRNERRAKEKKTAESVVAIFFGSFVRFSAPFAIRASCALHVVI
jgi:predicted nucleotidyltransferase